MRFLMILIGLSLASCSDETEEPDEETPTPKPEKQADETNRLLYTLQYDDPKITGPLIDVYTPCEISLGPKTNGVTGETLYSGLLSHICTYRGGPINVNGPDDQKIEYKLYLKGTCKVTVYLINHWRLRQDMGTYKLYAQGDDVDILIDGMTFATEVGLFPASISPLSAGPNLPFPVDPDFIQESNEFYIRAVRRLTIVLSNARGREYTLGIRPSLLGLDNSRFFNYHFHVAPVSSDPSVVEMESVSAGTEGDVSIDLSVPSDGSGERGGEEE